MAWISIAEAARRLGCTTRTVRNYIDSNELTLYTVGSPKREPQPLLRLNSSEVDALVRPVEPASR